MQSVTLLSRVNAVKVGAKAVTYQDFLMKGEKITLEFNGIGSILAVSQDRIILCRSRGVKLDVTSINWSSITAFSIESTGVLGRGSALKLWGSGFGCAEIAFQSKTDLGPLNRLICEKIYVS